MALTRLVIVASAAAAVWAADPRPTRVEWETKQAEQKAADQAVVDKAKKGAAVRKAVELLTSLQQKVIVEGEAEAKTYDKFACFCKDTTKEKLESIQKGEDEKAGLTAQINSLSSKRDQLDATIQETIEKIKEEETAMQQATAQRADTKKLYDTNAADLKAALDALEGAIRTLKASKTPSLAQVHSVSQTVQQAVLLADTMGLTAGVDKKVMAFLQQEPSNGNEVPMEDYDFHSDGIIKTLEKLLDSFRAEKTELDKEEASSINEFEMFIQAKTDEVKALNHKLDTAKEERDNTIADIEAANQRLTTVEATLADDKEYANKLSKMCSDKAKTWDQRSKVRAAELQTLTQAIGIISGVVNEKTSASTIRFMQQGVSLGVAESVAADADAMAAIEAASEAEDSPSFFQQKTATLSAVRRLRGSPVDSDGRAFVADMLKSRGTALKSTLLTSLASQLSKDPFAKVKVLIQELIERLLQEANNEANQKGWCDKATKDAKQKRDYAAEKVRALNAEMAQLEAVRDTLKEELDVLAKEIQDIKDARQKAQDERDAEAEQNAATIKEAQEGLEALNMCIDLLDKFYRTVAKETVDLSLAQGPKDDAPDAGFDNGEAYLGAQSESGGILAMLDVMKSDFTRTIQETERAEEQAQQDHLEFMTESGKSLAQKTEAEAAKKEQLDDTEEKFGEAEANLHSQTETLKTALKELLELKPVCVDTGMSYADRVARREDEIAALNKANCILGRYAEYGPEGAADGC